MSPTVLRGLPSVDLFLLDTPDAKAELARRQRQGDACHVCDGKALRSIEKVEGLTL